MIIGYTTGYMTFHVGHVDLLEMLNLYVTSLYSGRLMS